MKIFARGVALRPREKMAAIFTQAKKNNRKKIREERKFAKHRAKERERDWFERVCLVCTVVVV